MKRCPIFVLKLFPILLTSITFAGLGWADSNSVRTWKEGDYLYIQSNGIPDYEPGRFPNAGNPNRISAQDYTFRVPLSPQHARNIRPLGHDFFGVALNGVPFDPGTAEYWNNDHSSGWNYEALSGKIDLGLDHSHAHVQPNGAYHYHGVPTATLKAGASAQLIGYAADGFPIYCDKNIKSSYRLKNGKRSSGPGGHYDGSFIQDYEYVEGAGDLDECNGKTGPTLEHPDEIYHYYVTEDFPYVSRCFKGEPDPSFKKKNPHVAGSGRNEIPSHGDRRSQLGGGPPREAVEACEGRRTGDDCSFNTPHGTLKGRCEDVPEGVMACVPHD